MTSQLRRRLSDPVEVLLGDDGVGVEGGVEAEGLLTASPLLELGVTGFVKSYEDGVTGEGVEVLYGDYAVAVSALVNKETGGAF